MNKFVQYLNDVRSEMAKVSWPKRSEVSGATVLVVVLSIIMSLFVYACDWLLMHAVGLVLNKGL